MIPQTIDRYKIKSEIGRGGMATVFHAQDPRFERDVAVKVLPREFLHDPTFRARFEREAKTIAALEHSAIVPVYDFGEQDGQPYLVMRYMPGGSLADRLQKGPLPVDEAIRILRRIGAALDQAHNQGIIHRDLKPGNILFDQYADPYLADFGIVKLTQQTATFTGGAVIGTPAYMSPEQARGDANLDARSDIYALGAILFEILTGHQPYEADTPMGVAVKHIVEPVPRILDVNPNLPPDCATVINKAMAKDRVDRFQRAGDLVETLQLTMPLPAQRPDYLTPAPNLAIAGQQKSSPDNSQALPPESTLAEDATVLSKLDLVQSQTAEFKKKRPKFMVQMAIGWGVALLIGAIISSASSASGLLAGVIGGLGTGFILRRVEPALGWKQILVITIGWLFGFGFIFAGISTSNFAAALIGAAVGGVANGFALRRVVSSVRRKQVFMIMLGWLISLIITTIIAVPLSAALDVFSLPIDGAIFGAIGGWMMFRSLHPQ